MTRRILQRIRTGLTVLLVIAAANYLLLQLLLYPEAWPILAPLALTLAWGVGFIADKGWRK